MISIFGCYWYEEKGRVAYLTANFILISKWSYNANTLSDHSEVSKESPILVLELEWSSLYCLVQINQSSLIITTPGQYWIYCNRWTGMILLHQSTIILQWFTTRKIKRIPHHLSYPVAHYVTLVRTVWYTLLTTTPSLGLGVTLLVRRYRWEMNSAPLGFDLVGVLNSGYHFAFVNRCDDDVKMSRLHSSPTTCGHQDCPLIVRMTDSHIWFCPWLVFSSLLLGPPVEYKIDLKISSIPLLIWAPWYDLTTL